MSRSKRFLSSVGLSYMYQGLVMAVGLWLTPFMLKRIGQHDYGLWLVGAQILSYLMMLDFGVVALLPRETAYATGRAGGIVEHAKDLPRIVGETASVVMCQMPVVIAAVLLVWFLMPQAWHGFRGPITLALAIFTVMFPLRIFQAVLEGLQDLRFIGRVQILVWAISTGLMIVLILSGWGLYSLAASWSAAQLVSAGIMIFRVKHYFPSVLPDRIPRLTKSGLYDHFSRGFWVSLSQVAQPLLNGSDVLVIGKVFGPSMVVPYSCTSKLISVLSNQPNLLMQAAMPGLSELKTGESRERIFKATTALGQALLMLSGALACVVLVVNRGFVNWWVGPKQYGGATLTGLITVVMLLRHWNTTASYATFCFGYERRLAIATILDAIVTVGASIILVQRLGLIGAPIGAIVGVCGVSLPLNLSALCREVGVSFKELLMPLWPWFWRFLIVAGLAVVAGRFCVSLNLVQTATVSAIAALIYVAVMIQPSQQSALGSYLNPRFLLLRRKVSLAQ
jgi:O-antigen/teichoic acid export membrane protein